MYFSINGRKGLQFRNINLWNTLVFVKEGTLKTLRVIGYLVIIPIAISIALGGWQFVSSVLVGHIDYQHMSNFELMFFALASIIAPLLPWLALDYLRFKAVKAIVWERELIADGYRRTRYITDEDFSYQVLFPEGTTPNKLDPKLLTQIAKVLDLISGIYEEDVFLRNPNETDVKHRHLAKRRIIKVIRDMYTNSEFGTPELLARLDRLRIDVDNEALEAAEIALKESQGRQAALEGFMEFTRENALTA